MDISGLEQRLKEAGQSHLLSSWPELDPEEQAQLIQNLESLDFKELNQFFCNAMKSSSSGEKEMFDSRMEPVPREALGSVIHDREKLETWRETGKIPFKSLMRYLYSSGSQISSGTPVRSRYLMRCISVLEVEHIKYLDRGGGTGGEDWEPVPYSIGTIDYPVVISL